MAIGVGIDRLDYTKGLTEKFLAVEKLLESHPEFQKRFVFVQIAEPSRVCLPAYRELRSRLRTVAARINERFGADDYRPIVLIETHHEPEEVYRFLRGADLWHLACACYLAPDPKDLDFLTANERQQEIAKELGFKSRK